MDEITQDAQQAPYRRCVRGEMPPRPCSGHPFDRTGPQCGRSEHHWRSLTRLGWGPLSQQPDTSDQGSPSERPSSEARRCLQLSYRARSLKGGWPIASARTLPASGFRAVWRAGQPLPAVVCGRGRADRPRHTLRGAGEAATSTHAMLPSPRLDQQMKNDEQPGTGGFLCRSLRPCLKRPYATRFVFPSLGENPKEPEARETSRDASEEREALTCPDTALSAVVHSGHDASHCCIESRVGAFRAGVLPPCLCCAIGARTTPEDETVQKNGLSGGRQAPACRPFRPEQQPGHAALVGRPAPQPWLHSRCGQGHSRPCQCRKPARGHVPPPGSGLGRRRPLRPVAQALPAAGTPLMECPQWGRAGTSRRFPRPPHRPGAHALSVASLRQRHLLTGPTPRAEASDAAGSYRQQHTLGRRRRTTGGIPLSPAPHQCQLAAKVPNLSKNKT